MNCMSVDSGCIGAPPADAIAAVAPAAVQTRNPDERTWNQHRLPTLTLQEGHRTSKAARWATGKLIHRAVFRTAHHCSAHKFRSPVLLTCSG